MRRATTALVGLTPFALVEPTAQLRSVPIELASFGY